VTLCLFTLLVLLLLRQNIAMDTMTYGTIMFAHSREGDWQTCLHLLDDMKATDVRRDWYVAQHVKLEVHSAVAL
jgi:pentatricopeptide repeat protein